MAQYFEIHPTHPQARLLKQTSTLLNQGEIIATPTDSGYALVANLEDKDCAQALRKIRHLDDRHHLTLLCRDLSELAQFARVDNWQYRLLKLGTPGPYTFILEATKEVPRRVCHPNRKTIGLRVPEHAVLLELLSIHGAPLLSTTLMLPGDESPLIDPNEIRERLNKRIAGVIDAGSCISQPTTVIDLSDGEAVVVRQGQGHLDRLGL